MLGPISCQASYARSKCSQAAHTRRQYAQRYSREMLPYSPHELTLHSYSLQELKCFSDYLRGGFRFCRLLAREDHVSQVSHAGGYCFSSYSFPDIVFLRIPMRLTHYQATRAKGQFFLGDPRRKLLVFRPLTRGAKASEVTTRREEFMLLRLIARGTVPFFQTRITLLVKFKKPPRV